MKTKRTEMVDRNKGGESDWAGLTDDLDGLVPG